MRLRIRENKGSSVMSAYSNDRKDKKCYARKTVKVFDKTFDKEEFKLQLLEIVQEADLAFIEAHVGRR